MIYFGQGVLTRLIKIGYTSISGECRLKDLQTGSPDTLELLHEIEGPIHLEQQLHREFSFARRHGEWFNPCRAVTGFIDGLKSLGGQPEFECVIQLAKHHATQPHDIGGLAVEASAEMSDAIQNYACDMICNGTSKRHVAETISKVKLVLCGCGFDSIDELNGERAMNFLATLRSNPSRAAIPPAQDWFTKRETAAALGGRTPLRVAEILHQEGLQTKGHGKARRYHRDAVVWLQERFRRGIGAATSNAYVTAIRSFANWLLKRQAIKSHPESRNKVRDLLDDMEALSTQNQLRHVRRTLAADDLSKLLQTAQTSDQAFLGLSGTDRHALYLVAMSTGLRCKEIARLTPRSFILESVTPFVRNSKEAEIPLTQDVAVAIRGYIVGRPESLPLWPGKWFEHGAKMLRQDLKVAGIPYRDEDGRVCDMHALSKVKISYGVCSFKKIPQCVTAS